MIEKEKGKLKYKKTLSALLLRDIMAGKDEIDGNTLVEEARKIVNEGGIVKIVTKSETNLKDQEIK